MKIITTIASIFLLIFTWCWVDLKLGHKRYMKQATNIKYPPRNSDMTIFTSGKILFDDFMKEVKRAQHSIHILFYIVKNDKFSKDFLKLLQSKAEEGVEVRLLVDWVGSKKISRKTIQELTKSGVHFSFSFKPKLPFLFYTIQKRNHRKITVIDGKIGYLGGFNIGKEYINQGEKLNPWRDYHLKMTGEGVRDLQEVFLSDWFYDTNEDHRGTPAYFPTLTPGSQVHQVFVTNGSDLEQSLARMIQQANNKIIIGTPYFIPSETLFQELREALARNVSVTVIVPEKSDHALVKEASFPYFRVLLKDGAEIMQFQRGFYHSKVILIDDTICDIGTANFDKRSLFLNSEINCLVFDRAFIADAEKELAVDLAESKPLSSDALSSMNVVRSAKESLASVLSPFL
ncbi:cardiolipin synthase [Peribacillus simplex]|uniref:cardiolipin synthase n=1 Tax=Peribacillus simplex TaxID=1478 RepID=UPI000B646BBC|nr:cardiolipin synthase [Peribacillus simplex]MDF9758753.1 cardiolipin synthase [Peribacillus simplex]SNS82013.1 cardiolipin synthase [Bacillus sp. OK838]